MVLTANHVKQFYQLIYHFYIFFVKIFFFFVKFLFMAFSQFLIGCLLSYCCILSNCYIYWIWVLCKYVHHSLMLMFPLNRVLHRAKVLSLMKFSLSIFILLFTFMILYLRTHHLILNHEEFLKWFSLKVLVFFVRFSAMIHFELILIYSIRFSWTFFCKWCATGPSLFVDKDLSLLNFFCVLVKHQMAIFICVYFWILYSVF